MARSRAGARVVAARLDADAPFAFRVDLSPGADPESALAALEWVHRAENLAISGPSGTGKTHFVEALAHKVIDAGMRVSWFTLESLTAAIGKSYTRDDAIVIPLPHPSGASGWLNDVANRARLGKALTHVRRVLARVGVT